MKPIGIIANPNSGKDIRRLISPVSTFNDLEKCSIIKRLLLTLDGLGIEQVYIMPDPVGLGRAALHDIASNLKDIQVDILELPWVEATAQDSILSAQMMAELDCGCIITLGGDGTNRVVSQGCGDVPIMPMSTGTNNVFPFMMEATVAAMAAGAIASGQVQLEKGCYKAPLLKLFLNGELVDTALIDLVVVDEWQLGARAVWEVKKIRELFLTRARPSDVGLSSIGGCLSPMPLDSGLGMHVTLHPDGQRLLAPIVPGMVKPVFIQSHRTFGTDEEITIDLGSAIIALDGEREVEIEKGDKVTVKFSLDGPWVVNVDGALSAAVDTTFFKSE